MSGYTLLGYFIRRTLRAPRPSGSGFTAYGHRLYATREQAQHALETHETFGELDPAYDHDVTEAWFHAPRTGS